MSESTMSRSGREIDDQHDRESSTYGRRTEQSGDYQARSQSSIRLSPTNNYGQRRDNNYQRRIREVNSSGASIQSGYERVAPTSGNQYSSAGFRQDVGVTERVASNFDLQTRPADRNSQLVSRSNITDNMQLAQQSSGVEHRSLSSKYDAPIHTVRYPHSGNSRTRVIDIHITIGAGGRTISNSSTITPGSGSRATFDNVRVIDVDFRAPENRAIVSTDGHRTS